MPKAARNVLRALYAAGDAAGPNGDGREHVGRPHAPPYAGLAEGGRENAASKLLEARVGR